jgi:hypothetical protein
MTANPLNFRARRKAEKAYREGGWGPLLTFPVKRREGKPLVFQMRLPVGHQLVDLPSMARSAVGAPAALAAQTDALELASEAAGVIVVGALCPVSEGAGEPDVLATITVALSDAVAGPPTVEEGSAYESPHSHREVTKLSDKVTRIKRLSAEPVAGSDEPMAMLTMQYMIETRYGAVVMAFSTTRQDMFGGFGEELFEKIMATGFIGEGAQAY